MQDYRNYQIYVSVIQHGRITKAADALSMTKSSVSRILDQLESFWNAQLLIRSTRNITITEAGNEVYRHALRIIADKNETMQTIDTIDIIYK